MVGDCRSGEGLADCSGFAFLAAFSAFFRCRRFPSLFIFAHISRQAPPRDNYKRKFSHLELAVFYNDLVAESLMLALAHVTSAFDAVDGFHPKAYTCKNAVIFLTRRESGFGYKLPKPTFSR